ncbi:MAG: M14 family metallopeptidase [Chloroflexota bacterium]
MADRSNSEGIVYKSSRELVMALASWDKPLLRLGAAFGGEEVLCARVGGDRLPAIVITAGSHSPEVGGVHAVMRLISELETEHTVYIVPTRDPFGFNSSAHCLGVLLGRPVAFGGHAALAAILAAHGQVLWQEEGFCLALLGEAGFASMETGREPMGHYLILRRLHELFASQPALKASLVGRRVFMPAGMPFSEGTEAYGRTYTAVVAPEGQILSLSQFFGTAEAPPEVACIDALLRDVQPGLVFDCHEDFGRHFYLPARRHERDRERAERTIYAMHAAALGSGYPPADYDALVARQRGYRPYWPSYFQPSERPGLFWVDGSQRGYYCLADYALRFGLSCPIETGAEGPLAERVECQVRAVKAGIAAYQAGHD